MLRPLKLKGILLQIFLVSLLYSSCSDQKNSYIVTAYQTSAAGDNLQWVTSEPAENNIKTLSLAINPDQKFQEYIGFGASFTESSAWNLATIPVKLRKEVLERLFSPTLGAGFSLTRTHINSSDYANNHYTYVDAGDRRLHPWPRGGAADAHQIGVVHPLQSNPDGEIRLHPEIGHEFPPKC